jgi:hypothetical protein
MQLCEQHMTYDFWAPGCQTIRTKIKFPGSASDRRFLIAAKLGLLLELSRL